MCIEKQVDNWKKTNSNDVFNELYYNYLLPITTNVAKRYKMNSQDIVQDCMIALVEQLRNLKVDCTEAIIAQIVKYKICEIASKFKQVKKHPPNPVVSYNNKINDYIDYIDILRDKKLNTDVDIKEIVNITNLSDKEKYVFNRFSNGYKLKNKSEECSLGRARIKIKNKMKKENIKISLRLGNCSIIWKTRWKMYKLVVNNKTIGYYFNRSEAITNYKLFIKKRKPFKKWRKEAMLILKEMKNGHKYA